MARRKHTTDPTQLDLSFATVEEWRDIPGYEGYYQVSNLGLVRSLERMYTVMRGSTIYVKSTPARMLRLLSRKKKYLAVRLCKEGQQTMLNVHALVLMAFVGARPPGYTANHIDGNSLNNTAQNLEWVTPLANMQHAIAMGLIHPFLPRGEKNRHARLTEAEVVAIRRMRKDGVPNNEIARQFGLSPGATSMIATRKAWKHVE